MRVRSADDPSESGWRAAMMLAPRYEGPTILSIAGSPGDQFEPFIRQRRRMMSALAEMPDQQWSAASRCDGWTVRDVVAHLVGVNAFWRGSIRAGLAGAPTRVLGGFDPAATPPLMVDQMSALGSREVLAQFVSSTEALLDAVTGLSDEQWMMPAESPPGHVPINLLVQHALWDSWIHERDIALPLGLAAVAEADEVTSCLRYSAAISPALAMGLGQGQAPTTTLAVEATDPDILFVLRVDDVVSVGDRPADGLPCLRGDAVTLIEALSLRAPMPASSPHEWTQLLAGLATAFDAAI